MSQTGLYSQVVGVVGGFGPAQGLRGSAASAIVPDGLERAPSPKQQPKGSCKFQFENHPSGLFPHLEDVGSSWPWVLDAVDGEDKRGQGIDCKT